MRMMHSLTHSLTHSHTHSLTHSPTHSPTHSLTHSLTPSPSPPLCACAEAPTVCLKVSGHHDLPWPCPAPQRLPAQARAADPQVPPPLANHRDRPPQDAHPAARQAAGRRRQTAKQRRNHSRAFSSQQPIITHPASFFSPSNPPIHLLSPSLSFPPPTPPPHSCGVCSQVQGVIAIVAEAKEHADRVR